jgi:hypothetical protein
MRNRTLPALAIVGTLASLAAWIAPEPNEWTPIVQPLDTPAAPASAQPQLSSSNRGIILSWIEREGARAVLKFSERSARGWSSARVVASGTDWFVNWADVPSVVRLDDGTLATHWLQRSGEDTYAYDVRLSYSTDDGKSWAPSFTPHHDGTRTEHGFASLFQMPGGGLGVAWLDGRAMSSAAGHGSHGASASGAGGGVGAVGGMTVRFAAFDRDWKQVADMNVDDRVCECCPTTVAVTAEGPVVAYRNRTEDETRDIHVSRFVEGRWTESKPVHEDSWQIAACPVNGPVLSARGRDVAAAWFTGKGDQGRAFVAFSTDAGRTFGTPVRLDDAGALGRVDVELLPDRSAVATWIEFAGQRAQFRVRRVDRTGVKTSPVTIAGLQGNRAAGYPRLAVRGDELIFAWTETDNARSQVRTARASLP